MAGARPAASIRQIESRRKPRYSLCGIVSADQGAGITLGRQSMIAHAGDQDVPAPNLPDVPIGILVSLCKLLVEQRGGSPRDVVNLALASKALRHAICAADDIWSSQCRRLGWSLDWLPLCSELHVWAYFSRRMLVRWRLRRQLRRVSQFLDPMSRACLQPGAGRQDLEEAEAVLQLRLPWELFELLRWANGQEPRPGVHFADGARLLSLEEMRSQVQSQHGPAALGKGFRRWMTARQARSDDSPITQPGCGTAGVGQHPSTHSRSAAEDPGSSSALAPSSDAGLHSGQAPDVLMPFTDVLRGGKYFCLDFDGRVWLKSGFNTVFAADSLAMFLLGVLQ